MSLRISRLNLLLRSPLIQLRPPLLNTAIRCYANVDKSKPTTRKMKFFKLDDEMQALHRWLEAFSPAHIPKHLCKVTYSRSSGPGGQNVNKYPSPSRLHPPLDSR